MASRPDRDDPDDDDSPESQSGHKYPPPPSLESLGLVDPLASGKRLSGAALPKQGKFRFQLLADWIADHYAPCRVADIGGGKGLLTHMLRRQGFDAVVVDPHRQTLPAKYKDLRTGQRVRVPQTEEVPRLPVPFDEDIAKHFDLLVALHAHGANIRAIDGAARHGRRFVILPCCVIDEPMVPPRGVNWFSWLAEHATARGFDVGYFRLNFRGQNIGMYSRGAPPASGLSAPHGNEP